MVFDSATAGSEVADFSGSDSAILDLGLAGKSLRIFSWNVNGLRAILKKGALQKFLEEEKPDILCLQEIKATAAQIKEAFSDSGDFSDLPIFTENEASKNTLVDFKDYTEFWHPAKRAGYSGTAILVRNGLEVLSEKKDFPAEIAEKYELNVSDEFGAPNEEGRVLTLEFEKFVLVNVYVPNSKPELERLKLREKKWDPALREYLMSFTKPVVVCGDFNAAHEEIDLARPKANERSAGFTVEERRGISELIEAGFIDTFRFLHPEKVQYSWWSFRGRARENNVGWRIDYFFISLEIRENLKKAEILDSVFGSDHCPVGIELSENGSTGNLMNNSGNKLAGNLGNNSAGK